MKAALNELVEICKPESKATIAKKHEVAKELLESKVFEDIPMVTNSLHAIISNSRHDTIGRIVAGIMDGIDDPANSASGNPLIAADMLTQKVKGYLDDTTSDMAILSDDEAAVLTDFNRAAEALLKVLEPKRFMED